MALQLLKRNYVMDGYTVPKILKLPQGEYRQAPRRLPVDVGDVMMNIRMDDDKNRYIGEHVSKYSQGINPYGEWGYPYKVNKNNIRPPIIDPKFYEPLSRMPVKFDAVTAGPIVKDLYGKRVAINKVAPQTIIDKVCPQIDARPSSKQTNEHGDNRYREGSIELHLKKPHASIPYVPSMPVHRNTGVPDIELSGKLMVRPQMGIHFPFHVSDQSRDVNNMRTPMHVAVRPGYKDPYTFIQATPEQVQGLNEEAQNIAADSNVQGAYTMNSEIRTDYDLEPSVQAAAQSNIAVPVPVISNLTRDGYDLTPKVQTSAWYNPSYNLTNLSGNSIGSPETCTTDTKLQTSAQARPTMELFDLTERQVSERIDPFMATPINVGAKAPSKYVQVDHQGYDVPITTQEVLHASRNTNISSRLLQDGELGNVSLPDSIQAGEFQGKAHVPSIQGHQEFNRARTGRRHEYFFVQNHGKYGPSINSGTTITGRGEREEREDFQVAMRPTQAGAIRSRLQLQESRIDRTGVEPSERLTPVGTGRFIHNTF